MVIMGRFEGKAQLSQAHHVELVVKSHCILQMKVQKLLSITAVAKIKQMKLLQIIKDAGGEAFAIQADVSNPDSVKNMIDKTIETFGSIDILVNNAGITKDNLLMRMKEDEWDDVININLKGVFLCTKGVTRQMMRQRAGKIVNVASIVGVSGNPGQANYVAAKAGVIGFTKTTAKELATRNINVNAVAPGFITTDMTDALNEDVKETDA